MIASAPFGTTRDGRPVTRYTLTNRRGMSAAILDYGCIVQSLLVPAPSGDVLDVVLGYDDLAGYEAGSCFFGAFVGRYANRIAGAAFSLDGREYHLTPNEGKNHLHGVYCTSLFFAGTEGDSLILRRTSPAGEEGFPGSLDVTVTYTLDDTCALSMRYRAVTDAPTVLNLTNHSYFNLNGGGDILGHMLQLAVSFFTEGDAETLPTGAILPVVGTPFDFRAPKAIGRDIGADCQQLHQCQGYDHNMIFDREVVSRPAAVVRGDRSGLRMEMFTTLPAVQLYTGNFVDADTAPAGKGGMRYPKYAGLCLESQHYPCSPNFRHFPSTVLRPGEIYDHTTVYRFSGGAGA